MSRYRGRRSFLATGLLCLGLLGCAAIPRSQYEETRRQVLTLRAEVARTKDKAAKLSTQNREVVARAVEDARRIAALEEANEGLERSVVAYQDERDQYAEALRVIKSQVLASASSHRPSALADRLRRFVADHPGCRYDDASGRLFVPEEALFRRSSTALSPVGGTLLDALGRVISEESHSTLSPRIVARPDESPIRLASGGEAADPAHTRAIAIRDRLASSSRIAPEIFATTVEDDGTTPPEANRTVVIEWNARTSPR